MRALSVRQAANCETAQNKKCRCRCGGIFHGSGRMPAEPHPEFFAGLAADDPHHIDSKEQKKREAQIKARTGAEGRVGAVEGI